MIYDYSKYNESLKPRNYTIWDQKDFDLSLVSSTGITSKMAVLYGSEELDKKMMLIAFGYCPDTSRYEIVAQVYDDKTGIYTTYNTSYEIEVDLDIDTSNDRQVGELAEESYYELVEQMKRMLLIDADLTLEERLDKVCSDNNMILSD